MKGGTYTKKIIPAERIWLKCNETASFGKFKGKLTKNPIL